MTASAAMRDAENLLHALIARGRFPHSVGDVTLLETHISWVLLTGEFAYKIKKPVTLDFLDFSTLAARRRYCEDELRLNRRWAPSLYLEVIAITGDPAAPVAGGSDDVLEYAVKMRQFPQAARLDAQLDEGAVSAGDMRALAEDIAARHHEARQAGPMPPAEAAAAVAQPVMDNFPHLKDVIAETDLHTLKQWTQRRLKTLEAVLGARAHGFVRECHGDLHLGNLVRLEAGIQAFDCIEFSEDLRLIDVLSDVAFLVMDLAARHRQDLGFVFLNRYLEVTGDYAGLKVFGLYFVYRCLIRAKVASIRSRERDVPHEADSDQAEARRYADLAQRWTGREGPLLVAMHGYSASGKSWLSAKLMAALPAVRLRSDIERKRLHGLEETQGSASGTGAGLYRDAARDDVYRHLFEQAASALREGYSVILDASFLEARQRQRARDVAAECGQRFVIVSASAGEAELKRRLAARAGDASEADAEVLAWQRDHADPLTAGEQAVTIAVDTASEPVTDEIVARIRQLA